MTYLAKCNRCKRELIEIESHHIWCKFMDNPHGYTWKDYPNRMNLCLNCHKAIHQIIVIPYLNKLTNSNLAGKYAEYQLWKKISLTEIKQKVIEDICSATIKFIFEYEDGNTTTA